MVGPLESAMSAYIDFAKSGQAMTSKTNSYFFLEFYVKITWGKVDLIRFKT